MFDNFKTTARFDQLFSREEARQLVDHTIDRIRLQGWIEDTPDGPKLTMPLGDEWCSALKVVHDKTGKIHTMGVFLGHFSDEDIVVVGFNDEILPLMSNPRHFGKMTLTVSEPIGKSN